MSIFNNGTLEIQGNPTDKEVEKAVSATIGTAGIYISGSTIDINDRPDSALRGKMERLVEELNRNGCPVTGCVTFYGDEDGAFEINEDGTITDYDAEDWAVHNYDDAGLIEELLRRGYSVGARTKNPEQNIEYGLYHVKLASTRETEVEIVAKSIDHAIEIARQKYLEGEVEFPIPINLEGLVIKARQA